MVKERNPYLISNPVLPVQIARLTRSIHLAGSFENTPTSVLVSYVNLLHLRDWVELRDGARSQADSS
jgi:hypothetical protein